MTTWWRSLWVDEKVAAVGWLMALAWVSAAVWPVTVFVAVGCLTLAGIRRWAK